MAPLAIREHPDGVYEFDMAERFQQGNSALTPIKVYPEGGIAKQRKLNIACYFNLIVGCINIYMYFYSNLNA